MTTDERAARIIATARRLLRAGRARGWSEAIKMAREQADREANLWSQSPEQ